MKILAGLLLLWIVGVLIPNVSASCPGNLLVDLVDSTPAAATLGAVIATRIHVVYPSGDPAVLIPESASFLWTGPAGQISVDDQKLTFTGTAGFYSGNQQVTAAILQATGEGQIKISVAACSVSDAKGAQGPIAPTSLIETLTPSDKSIISIHTFTSSTFTFSQPAAATTAVTATSAAGPIPLSGNFMSMTLLMLAAVTIGVLLVVAILAVRILLRPKREEEGLYGDG